MDNIVSYGFLFQIVPKYIVLILPYTFFAKVDFFYPLIYSHVEFVVVANYIACKANPILFEDLQNEECVYISFYIFQKVYSYLYGQSFEHIYFYQ